MSATIDAYFIGNTMLVELGNGTDPLTDPVTGAVENGASVACTIVDEAGSPLAGQAWPLAMPWVGLAEPGVYRAEVAHGLALGIGQRATVRITADIGGVRYYADRAVRGTRRVGEPTAYTPAPEAAAFLVLSTDTVELFGEVGDGQTHEGTISVLNGGGGTLPAPTISSISYGAGWSAGLQVVVTGASAPYTVTVTATTGALSANTYTAAFSVVGAVNSELVNVSFEVAASSAANWPPPSWTLPAWATFNTTTNQVDGEPMSVPSLGSFS